MTRTARLLLVFGLFWPAFSWAQITDILKTTPNPVTQRVFRDLLKEDLHIDALEEKAPFFKASMLVAQDEDNIVTWDTKHFYRWSIHNPERAMRIGAGFGGGPAEYRSPQSAFIRNGTLYAIDSEALKVLSWNLQTGKFLHTVRQPSKVEGYQVVVDTEGKTAYALSFLWSSKGQIHRFDLQAGKAVESFMQLPDDPLFYTPECHDGKIAIDEKGNVYHASNNAGNLSKFSPGQGGYVYNVAVVSDHKNDCKVREEKRGNYVFTRRSATYMPLTIDIEYQNGKLYLLHSGRKSPYGKIIDVYEAESGKYLHTLNLAREASDIAVVQDAIFALERDGDSYSITQYGWK